jgi:hypothetical protein
MRKIPILLCTGTLIITAISALGDSNEVTSDLKALMTPRQYKSAGLEKLTEEERKALSEWFQFYLDKTGASKVPAGMPAAATAAVAAPSAAAEPPEARITQENFGFPERPEYEKEGAFELKANVIKPFRGWSGKTVFTLDNGQVWRQRASGKYTYMGDDTRVVISQNRYGFYNLRLLAADRSVGVTRVK